MFEKPNAIAVWGKQTLEHAVKIHGFIKQNVFLLGNPKFDFYKTVSKKKYKPIVNCPYVLFLGVREDIDELGPLKILNSEIKKNKNIYKDLKILYRPHPYNSKEIYKKFIKLNLKNVKFDLSSDLRFYKTKTRNNGNINSNYYLSLIKNSSYVIGGITTVLIECLLLKKKYLVLSHFDKDNFLSTRNIYKSFKHFDGIENIKDILISKSKKDLTNFFKTMFLDKNLQDHKEDRRLKYFYFYNNNKYSINLLDICKKMIT